jgi:hypothetical protein
MCCGNLSITHYIFIENVQNKNLKQLNTFNAQYFVSASLMAFTGIKRKCSGMPAFINTYIQP